MAPDIAEMPTVAVLTASQERSLYHTDHAAWLRYVAPRMAAKLTAASADDVGDRWAELPRDYQRAVWPHLHTCTRQRIRAVRVPVSIAAG